MKLMNIDILTESEIINLQDLKLRSIADYALKNSHYANIRPDIYNFISGGIDALPSVSILTSSDLAKHNPPKNVDFVCDSKQSGVVLASGGSSGERKTVFHSWEFFNSVMQMGARGLHTRMGRKPKRIANCFLPGSLWGGFVFGNGVAQFLHSQLFALGRPPIAELVSTIKTYEIDCFFSSPSFAYSVFLSQEIEPSDLQSITDFCYVGESLSATQVIQIKSKYPNLKIHSLAYTANETGTLGYQCPNQSGGLHHIHEDFVLMEIVHPETTSPVAVGEEGEVVVTTLDTTGTPLFRYRIGDLAINKGRNCSCGSSTLVIDLIGRVPTSTNICGTIVSFDYFAQVLAPVCKLGPNDIQIVIQRVNGKTKFEVLFNEKVINISAEKLDKIIRNDTLIQDIINEPQSGGFCVKIVSASDFIVSERTGKKLMFFEKAD